MDKEKAADEHAGTGGNRAAFIVAGWDTLRRGEGLFRAARAYQGDEQAYRSFVHGFHAADAAAFT